MTEHPPDGRKKDDTKTSHFLHLLVGASSVRLPREHLTLSARWTTTRACEGIAMAKEPRAHFPLPRHHYYRIECAWCKGCIGWKLKNVSVPGETTYGICPSCFAGMVDKVQQMHAFRDEASAVLLSG
jgi:hypothetical protein